MMRIAIVAPDHEQGAAERVAEALAEAHHEVFQLHEREVSKSLTDVLLTRAEVVVPIRVDPALVACVKEFGCGLSGSDAKTRLFCQNEDHVRRTLAAFHIPTATGGETVPVLIVGDPPQLQTFSATGVPERDARENLARDAYRALGLQGYGVVEVTATGAPAIVCVRPEGITELFEEPFWVAALCQSTTAAEVVRRIAQRAWERRREL